MSTYNDPTHPKVTDDADDVTGHSRMHATEDADVDVEGHAKTRYNVDSEPAGLDEASWAPEGARGDEVEGHSRRFGVDGVSPTEDDVEGHRQTHMGVEAQSADGEDDVEGQRQTHMG